jgi:cyclic pyranopterin phosphate synthase
MPAELFGDRYEFLPKREILTFEEIERLAGIFIGLGVRKIRLTGGEPLLRAQLPRLVAKLAALEGVDDLALTTNGYLLGSHAAALRDAGLRRITVSLDSLDEEILKRMNGRDRSVRQILGGIDIADRVGLSPIKINCVVQRRVNDHTIVDLARHFKGSGHIVRFIEFMDVGTVNGWEISQVVTAREILARIHHEMSLEPVNPNYPGEVARRYRYADGEGEIGIIASVSQPFCDECTRARLTPDGHLVTCLFAIDGVDLKGPMRSGASDAELREEIRGAWSMRSDRYSKERSEKTAFEQPSESRTRIEMHQLGG